MLGNANMNKLLLAMLLAVLFGISACEKKDERILPKVNGVEQAGAADPSVTERNDRGY